MANFVVILIIVAILSGATAKLVSEKKKGAKCVGCPYSGQAGGSACSCHVDK